MSVKRKVRTPQNEVPGNSRGADFIRYTESATEKYCPVGCGLIPPSAGKGEKAG